ncbi:hypothetical protein AAHE18_03G010000 [Arachis hypogaea]
MGVTRQARFSIRAGDGFHNLKKIKIVELVKPTGWVYLSLLELILGCEISAVFEVMCQIYKEHYGKPELHGSQ